MIRGLALVLALPLAGCAIFTPAAERAGELARQACTEPRDVRELVLARINQYAAPHAVALRCANDQK